MCDPATIVGLALSAGSVAANSAASGQVQSARDDALAAERIRQRGYQKETSALNAKSQDRFSDFDKDAAAKTTTLADYFKGNQVPGAPPQELMPAATNNVVVNEQAKQSGKAKAFSDQQGDALGKMRAFGDVLGQDSRLQAREASQIGQIGGFEKGSSNVLGYELENANNAGAGMRIFGDLLAGGGQLASGGFGGTFGAAARPAAAGARSSMPSMAAARAADRASVPGYSAPLRFMSL